MCNNLLYFYCQDGFISNFFQIEQLVCVLSFLHYRQSEIADTYSWIVTLFLTDFFLFFTEKRDKEREKNREREDRKRDDRKRVRGSSGNNQRYADESPPVKSGFSARPTSDEEDNYNKSPPSQSNSRSGAAIAPPPSLQDEGVTINPEILKGSNVTINYGSSSVAAKIMAKYGFRDGQGLGKQEQGMSMALQVEKTSKRGGRIIHEKELFMPPPPPGGPPPPPPSTIGAAVAGVAAASTATSTPTTITQMAPPDQKPEPSITEIMKAPSKVVLLRVISVILLFRYGNQSN